MSVVRLPHVVDEVGRLAESLLGNEPARTLGQEGVGEDEGDVEENVDQGEGVPVAQSLGCTRRYRGVQVQVSCLLTHEGHQDHPHHPEHPARDVVQLSAFLVTDLGE